MKEHLRQNIGLGVKYISRLALLLYGIIVSDYLLRRLSISYTKALSFSTFSQWINNELGIVIFTILIGLVLLHITNIRKIEKWVFRSFLLLLVINLLLVYLDIKRQGDS